MASTSTITTKRKDEVFLVGHQAPHITGCKLPCNRQVMANLFYNLRTEKLNLRDSAKKTIKEVLIFWETARIPTKHVESCIDKLNKLYEDWKKIQKHKNRQTEGTKNKIKEFESMLDDIFDIAHRDALDMMKSEQDKEFLLKQREKGRPGSMLEVNLKSAQAKETKLQKPRTAIKRKIQEKESDKKENKGENNDEEKSPSDEDSKERPGPSNSKKMKRAARSISIP